MENKMDIDRMKYNHGKLRTLTGLTVLLDERSSTIEHIKSYTYL